MQQRQMKRVIHNISMLQAIQGTRVFCIIGLIVSFLVQVYCHYAVTALTILLCYLVLPSLVEGGLKNRYCKGKESVLEEVQKRYGFSPLQLASQRAGYGILLMLLGVWQYANIQSSIISLVLKYYPSLLLGCSVVICTGLYLYYRIKIPYLVKNNLV